MTTVASPRVLVPLEISDAMLISSSVAETDYPAWSATEICAAGDYRIKDHGIWLAKLGKKAVVTITIAAPGVVTWYQHGLPTDTPIVFTTTGALPTGIAAGTTYYVKYVDANSFQLVSTPGGTAITTTGTQSGVHTCGLASNYNKPPATSIDAWEYLEATNRWKMFDDDDDSQTTATTSISVVLQPGFFTDLALYGLKGATLSVTIKDAPGGNVIRSVNATLQGPFIDEWDYEWGLNRQMDKYLITGLPPYPNAEITLTVSASPGTQVAIGMLAIGSFRSLVLRDWGGTEYGASAEPVSSTVLKRENGKTKLVRRGGGTNMRINLVLPQQDADYAVRLLQDVIDVPACWVGTIADGYAGLNSFGVASGSIQYVGPNHAAGDIFVKGIY